MDFNLPKEVNKTLSEYPAGTWYLYVGKEMLPFGKEMMVRSSGGTPYSSREIPSIIALRVEEARKSRISDYDLCRDNAVRERMAGLVAQLKKTETMLFEVTLVKNGDSNRAHISEVKKLDIPLQNRI